MLTYDTLTLRQTGSRNLTGQKTLPTICIWSLWPNIRFLPSIVAEKNATKNGHIQNVCPMCIKINKVSKQEVGIWWVQKRFPRYGVPIWSLWPNIRSLPSIVAEKNVTKNVHICLKSEGEVTSLSGADKREVRDNREKWREYREKQKYFSNCTTFHIRRALSWHSYVIMYLLCIKVYSVVV